MSEIYIRVTAPEGRRTPVHPIDGSAPGGGLLYVIAGETRRVRWSQSTRRAVGNGDLIPCDAAGHQLPVAAAVCPEDIEGGPIVLPAPAEKGSK
jgi:hypothetical protein